MKKWKRLDVSKMKDKNIGQGDPDEPDPPGYVDPCKVNRVYGPRNGREWPRLTISIYEMGIDGFNHRDDDTFKLSCNRKNNPDAWWSEAEIPIELANDVVDILREYMASKAKK